MLPDLKTHTKKATFLSHNSGNTPGCYLDVTFCDMERADPLLLLVVLPLVPVGLIIGQMIRWEETVRNGILLPKFF